MDASTWTTLGHAPALTTSLLLLPTAMLAALRWATVGVGLLMVAGTLLGLSRSPHPLVRIWDFPRLQIAALAVASGAAYGLAFLEGRPLEWAFLAGVGGCAAWQLSRVFPYTPLARVQVQCTRRPPEGSSFRLLVSNVLMENESHDLLLRRISECDPDVVLLLEVNQRWARALEPLDEGYPFAVRQPQENYYGLLLLSRLPLVDPRVEFLVQDDVPSVRAGVRLTDGGHLTLRGIHPRPPEPVRNQKSTPRDAELVGVGHAVREAGSRPTVVAGDLNDVAWSHTTQLFLRLSGLLDPRIGRGLYNSYNAKSALLRYPLDHVFHSSHFRLVELRRLESIGSDHFPILAELSREPDASAEQAGMEAGSEDAREAQEKLAEQAEAAATGDDRPGNE